MKHIHKKWLLLSNNYSAAACIISHIASRITKLDILMSISNILSLFFLASGIILFCNDYYTTRSIRAAIKKNRYYVIFWLVWTLFIILLFLCK